MSWRNSSLSEPDDTKIFSARDHLCAFIIFSVFAVSYLLFRYQEALGDSCNTIWIINNYIADGKLAIYRVIHLLNSFVFQIWILLLDHFSIGEIRLGNELTNQFASNLLRVVYLNALSGALALGLTFLICRSVGASIKASVLAVLAFGFSTGTWIIFASGERQAIAILTLSVTYLFTTLLRKSNIIAWVIGGLMVSIFSILMVLIYLPLLMFFPVIILLVFAQIYYQFPEIKSFKRELLSRAKVVLSVLIPLFTVSYLAFHPVITRFMRRAFSFLFNYTQPGSENYYNKISPEMITNNILTFFSYFTGWVRATGIQKVVWNPFQSNIRIILFLFSLGISLLLCWIAVSSVMRIKNIKTDKSTVFKVVFGVHYLIGFLINFYTRQGYTVEFWTYVIWAAVPLIALVSTSMLESHKRWFVYGAVGVLIGVNFLTGCNRFFVPFVEKIAHPVKMMDYVTKAIDVTNENDVFLIYLRSRARLLSVISNDKRHITIINSYENNELDEILTKSIQEQNKIYILQNLFEHPPDEKNLDTLDTLYNEFFSENLLMIQEAFKPVGSVAILDPPFDFIEIEPIDNQ